MKRSTAKWLLMLMCFFLMRWTAPRAAAAQVSSSTATVALSMNVPESITLQPSTQTLAAFVFNRSSGITDQKQFTLTTSWFIAAGHTHFDANFWFTTPTAALADAAGDKIPSSEFYLQVDAGTMQACNFNPATDVPQAVAGGTCNAGIAYPLTAGSGTQSNTMTVEMQNLPTTLPVGNYTGTLNVAAGAN